MGAGEDTGGWGGFDVFMVGGKVGGGVENWRWIPFSRAGAHAQFGWGRLWAWLRHVWLVSRPFSLALSQAEDDGEACQQEECYHAAYGAAGGGAFV